MFLIRETPSLSNIFIPLVYFFHVRYMLTAMVPDLSEKGEWEGGKGEPCLAWDGTASARKAFLSVSSLCLLKQRIWLHHFKASAMAHISWLAFTSKGS